MDATMRFSVKKWYRRLLKMPIGYVGYNFKLPYIWVSDHTWVMRPDRLVSIPVFNGESHGAIFRYPLSCNFRLFDVRLRVALCWLRCGGASMLDGWPCMVGDL